MPNDISGYQIASYAQRSEMAIDVSQVGTLEGQRATWKGNSESMLEAAYKMDDEVKESRVVRDKLLDRDIKDKKKNTKRTKIIHLNVQKTDPMHGTQKYLDFESVLKRIKQQVALQNQWASRDGESSNLTNDGKSRSLTYDGEELDMYMLRTIPVHFDEVTQQDSALGCSIELADFDSDCAKEEVAQCKKMLLRLENNTDEKSIKVAEEFKAKIETLEKQISLESAFKDALSKAREGLRNSHGKEISDGYNIYPKAVALSKLIEGTMPISDIVAVYRDKILCCDNFQEVFTYIVDMTMCRGGGEQTASSEILRNEALAKEPVTVE
jgi:hypothetical protein